MRFLPVMIGCILASGAAWGQTLEIDGNRVELNGLPGLLLHRDSGDLDGDGIIETALAVRDCGSEQGLIVVARRLRRGWQVVTTRKSGYNPRVDITDLNGDGRLELIERSAGAGEGHGFCSIWNLWSNKLVLLRDFANTSFRDLDGDRIPEVLSVEPIGPPMLGDHWLVICRWNGKGWTDVSRRFPRAYDAVIRGLRSAIREWSNAKYQGISISARSTPGIIASLYYYLGRAYEYRGVPEKAKQQYAIAYRLSPKDKEIVSAFRRTWVRR